MTDNVFDAARFILNRTGRITAMKLQRLCYYTQAWSLVWDGCAMFRERIEAWANGPIVPVLYHVHDGKFTVDRRTIPGNSRRLGSEQRKTTIAVLDYYGNKSTHWLTQLVHAESPWLEARGPLKRGEPGTATIGVRAMADYYWSL